MADDYVVPAIAANARYEGKYPLVSALSRPVIVRHLVAEARRHGADAVAHGCTGKGNDQVRFEVGTRALAPDLEILAPARSWGMTREDCVDYAARPRHPHRGDQGEAVLDRREPLGPGHRVRRDRGPLGAAAAPTSTRSTRPTATEPREVVVGFEAGVPVRVDGRALGLAELIAEVGADRRRATAGAGSTWSRTAGSGSRAARSTSARPRWR